MNLSLQSLEVARCHHRDLAERAAAFRARRALPVRPSTARRPVPARLIRWVRAVAPA